MEENMLGVLMDGMCMDDDGSGGGSLAALAPLLPALLPGLLKTLVGDPEMMQEIVRNAVGQYKPAIYAVLNELLVAYEDFASNERIPSAQAKLKWNAYRSYIDAGFTAEQAMVFLVNSDSTSRGLIAQSARILGSTVTT